jgi:hypothetical protein
MHDGSARGVRLVKEDSKSQVEIVTRITEHILVTAHVTEG